MERQLAASFDWSLATVLVRLAAQCFNLGQVISCCSPQRPQMCYDYSSSDDFNVSSCD